MFRGRWAGWALCKDGGEHVAKGDEVGNTVYSWACRGACMHIPCVPFVEQPWLHREGQ